MTDEIIHESRITPPQLLILAVMYLANTLNGFAIVIISYTAPAIARDLSIESGQLGTVFSAGLLGMTLGAMFVASLADVYGRRSVAAGALVISGLATGMVFVVESVGLLIVARILSGVGVGTLFAVLPAYGSEYSPVKHRNFIVAALVSSSSVGSVIGGLICSWWLPQYGWASLYMYTGVALVAGAVVFYFFVPESMAYRLNRASGDVLAGINKTLIQLRQDVLPRLPPRSDVASESASVKSLLTPSRRATTLMAWITFFCGFAGMYFLVTWLPKLLVDSGVSQEQSIQAVVIMTLGSIAGALIVGWLSRWWSLNSVIAVSFALSTLFILWLSFELRHPEEMSITLAWALSLMVGVLLLGAFGNLYSVALSLYPDAIKVTGLGWCIGLGRGGAVLSPLIAGLLLGAGVSSPDVLAYSSVTVLLAAVGTKLVTSRKPAPVAEATG